MSFLKISKICLAVSAILVTASVVLFFYPGPRVSIEFAGGTLMEVTLPQDKTKEDLSVVLASAKPEGKPLENFFISSLKGGSLIVRTRTLTNEEHVALLKELGDKLGKVDEMRFTTIGPSVSANLKRNSLIALGIASLALITYLAFAFRKLPQRLNPWKFGVLAVLAFLHDVILTMGIFVIISHYTSFELDPLFVTALLTILAYSANDTIVIFDRIRSVLAQGNRGEDLSKVVASALWQCVTRTFSTTMAALIMLTSLFLMGAESIHWFILALIVGTIIGTYSSYFIAAPLLVFWSKKA